MSTATRTLGSMHFARILSSPTNIDDEDQSPLRRAILAGLLDAGVRGIPVAALWVRPEPWAAVRVLISGVSAFPQPGDHSDQARTLLFPLGATGTPVTGSELAELLAPFASWKQCTGTFEPLLLDTGEATGGAKESWSSSPFDDVVGYLAHFAFAWLVFATPVSDDEVTAELDHLRRELFRLHQGGQVSEAEAIERERKQKRFRELSRAGTAGIWDVVIAVGTKNAGDTARVASVLCTAAERSTSSYKIRPTESNTSSADAAISGPDRLAFRATVDLAASLVRPPESELPGFRAVVPPSFDTTPEGHSGAANGVTLCTVLDRFLQDAGPLSVSLDTLNRHTFVCGATGGGKSQTIRNLLETVSRRGRPIPWMVIEPAKAEYARMAGRLKGVAQVVSIRPGQRDAPPASINPLQPASLEPGNPERTFPLQGHADLVRALFLAAFQAEEPFPQVLSRALVECYASAGWDLVTGEPRFRWDAESGQPAKSGTAIPRYPTLASLQRMATEVVESIGYDEDIRKRVRGFVDVRIGSLRLGTPGRFFEGGHPLDVAEVLRRNLVFELETVTNDQDKAFVMGAILIRIYEQLLLEEKERFKRDRGKAPFRHITVIEEAHRLLRNVVGDSPAAHSLELFASLLAEVRAYGEGLVVAEQIPSKLIPDVIKNTALKVVHRLPAADDRLAVGATMNLSDVQSQYVVSLEPGVGAIFTDGMDRPVLGRIPKVEEERETDEGVESLPPLYDGRRRSDACGHECRSGKPCTLLAMRHAEQLLEEHPELTLWAETACSTHLIGHHAPGLKRSPGVAELERRRQLEPRIVECAIAHAVEQAITARYEGIVQFFDPDVLARHLALAGIAAIQRPDLPGICKDDRGRWRAGRQRFADVESWLTALVEDGAHTKSQEDAVRVAVGRGLSLMMISSAPDQLSYLKSLPWRRFNADAQAELLLGSAKQRLIKASSDLEGSIGDDRERLERAFELLLWADPKDTSTLMQQILPPDGAPAGAAQPQGARDGR